jgi:hypothetical protein
MGTWNALINEFVVNVHASKALEDFLDMQREGIVSLLIPFFPNKQKQNTNDT